MAVTLAEPKFAEFEIKKSRFLGWVEPVSSVQAAKQRIADIRQQYPDARHVCTAFYVKGQTGLSDDGEPSGTAAKPMFNVLNHKGLVDVVAIVVRYFGGIKLGAGGLSRAYGNAISLALENAELLTVESQWQIALSFPFGLENQVRHVLGKAGLQLQQVAYHDQVSAELTVKQSQKNEVCELLQTVAPAGDQLSISVSALD
ncbi:IMPACT family protein [Reinekea thalattae]|uniref:YigZ family protein n=1 Tax=Reinekea thalattae TaxID=2593301 RepID=A0A5C8Z8W6_9GAMM|nr:YigZ family protein [Reinekea thalattae]TXR54127.1 YigZ family protein [Reinekea thalattae]